MDFATLFSAAGGLAMLGWLLLVLLPRWRGTACVTGLLVPGLLAGAYAALIGVGWSRAGGGFGSLTEVRTLFQSDPVLLAGWLHYLAFDLLVGRWICTTARREGLPHWSIVHTLVLTFLFGPVGWLAFQIQRHIRTAWRAAPSGWAQRLVRLPWGPPQPLLAAVGTALLLLALPTALAYALDDRVLATGVGLWVKPLKFELSLGVYLFTLAVLFPLAGPGFGRTVAGRCAVWGACGAALFEVGYISLMAAQGLQSHFNVATPRAVVMYSLMGAGAFVLTLASALLAWAIARNPASPARPLLRTAVVTGLAMTFLLGTIGGFVMSAGQSAMVGGAPGPGDLPLLGWSGRHGDLRVAHFLAMHAVQLMPLSALLVAGWPTRRAQVAWWSFAAVYAALTVAVFVQARAGLPLSALLSEPR